MIKVKVKITSNEELMRSGGRKINTSIRFAEKKRESHRLACFCCDRKRAVDVENGELRVEKFKCDRTEYILQLSTIQCCEALFK